MGFSEAQEELVLRSWKAMKPDSESIALKFFLRCPFNCIAHASCVVLDHHWTNARLPFCDMV
jgi:hypothetical protein